MLNSVLFKSSPRLALAALLFTGLACSKSTSPTGLDSPTPSTPESSIPGGTNTPPDPTAQGAASFDQKMDAWTEAYFAAHHLTEQFDQELDRRLAEKSPDQEMEPMTNTPLYQQLNLVKETYQRQQEEILSSYRQSLRALEAPRQEIRRQANQEMNLVYESLQAAWEKEPLARLAYLDLFQEMENLRLENQQTPPLPQTSREILSFFKVQSRTQVERQLRLQKQQMQERAQKSRLPLPPSPPQSSWHHSSPLSPSHHIKPSTGASGNLRGSEFASGTWVLTFDDGPHPSITPALVKEMNDNGVRATFFWLAKNARQYPQIVRDTISSGHLVASHTWTHPDLSKNSVNHQREVMDAHEEIDRLANGQISDFFRCPYGSCIFNGNTQGSRRTRQLLADNDIIHVLWNVDTLDWKPDSAEVIYNRTIKQMQGLSRGIILFHDIHQRSLSAATRLIRQNLRQNPPATLEQAVREANKLQ